MAGQSFVLALAMILLSICHILEAATTSWSDLELYHKGVSQFTYKNMQLGIYELQKNPSKIGSKNTYVFTPPVLLDQHSAQARYITPIRKN